MSDLEKITPRLTFSPPALGMFNRRTDIAVVGPGTRYIYTFQKAYDDGELTIEIDMQAPETVTLIRKTVAPGKRKRTQRITIPVTDQEIRTWVTLAQNLVKT